VVVDWVVLANHQLSVEKMVLQILVVGEVEPLLDPLVVLVVLVL
jgi:hypothetical protein